MLCCTAYLRTPHKTLARCAPAQSPRPSPLQTRVASLRERSGAQRSRGLHPGYFLGRMLFSTGLLALRYCRCCPWTFLRRGGGLGGEWLKTRKRRGRADRGPVDARQQGTHHVIAVRPWAPDPQPAVSSLILSSPLLSEKTADALGHPRHARTPPLLGLALRSTQLSLITSEFASLKTCRNGSGAGSAPCKALSGQVVLSMSQKSHKHHPSEELCGHMC